MIVPFEAWHLDSIELQPAQMDVSELIHEEGYGEGLEMIGGWSLLDGEITIACGGLIPAGHKALAWMLVSKHAGPYMVRMIRKIKSVLQDSHFKRIEMVVDDGFKEGFRMAEMLGFTCETPQGMKHYYEGGGSAFLFARS